MPLGIIKGNLTCADADVEGRVEGVLKVDGLLTLRSNANIEGEISTGKLQVEEGAEFSGQCKMSNFIAATTTTSASKENMLQEDVVY